MTTTHSIVNKMLAVELKNDEGVIRSDKDWEVPAHLVDIIAFVDNVSNPKLPRRKVQPSIETDDDEITLDKGLVNDEVIAKLYNIVDNTGSSERSVGAMEYSGASGFSVSDLKKN